MATTYTITITEMDDDATVAKTVQDVATSIYDALSRLGITTLVEVESEVATTARAGKRRADRKLGLRN